MSNKNALQGANVRTPCISLYTSHELRIGFQCNGSCKGPYTLTAVSDYNAWYNETLNSFFYQRNNDQNKMANGTPL